MNQTHLGWFGAFLDALDSGGGHLLLLFGLIVIGCAIVKFIEPMAGIGIVTGAFSAILMAMQKKGSNREQLADTTMSAVVTTEQNAGE